MQTSAPAGATSQVFDAVVVGSGATGGWAAKKLTEGGLKVALLEAGKKITPKDFNEHKQPWEVPFLNLTLNREQIAKTRPIQSLCGTLSEFNQDWFVNDLENPYTTPEDKPFRWIRQ